MQAWIEECEPRPLGPAFTAAKSDLILLFRKLFEQVEVADDKPKKGMDPKFSFTPKEGEFSSYTLTVRFKYHRFPITYNFNMEPIPSPQEFLRDNIIKPLLFTTLRLTRQLEDFKSHAKTKLDFTQLDPNSRDLKHATRNPYLPINGFGASLLDAYFKAQLDASVHLIHVEDPQQTLSDSQSLQPSQGVVAGAGPKKETWKMDPIRVDSNNQLVLDLHYDSVLSPVNGIGQSIGVSSGSGSIDSKGDSLTLGEADNSLPTNSAPVDPEQLRRDEANRAAEIEERLEKKKRKREAREAAPVPKRPNKFL